MTEELARSGIDPVSAAAEIDLVEVQLENLRFREFPLKRQRQYPLAQFAAKGLGVVEEHRARQLLGDGRAALPPGTGLGADLERARDPDRINPDMRIIALVLGRKDRVLHHLRNLARAQPFAIAWPQRDQFAAIARAYDDHLFVLVGLQLIEIGQGPRCQPDRDDQRDQREQAQRAAPCEQAADQQAPAARRLLLRIAGTSATGWRGAPDIRPGHWARSILQPALRTRQAPHRPLAAQG